MRAIAKTCRRFWRLRGPERTIVLEAGAVLVATRIGLHAAGFRGWKWLLELFTPAVPPKGAPSHTPTDAAARAIARLEAATARNLPFRSSCLERSLSLWWLLRRCGIPAEICAGARKKDGGFEAHAWVEWNGVVLSDDDERAGFVPFDGPLLEAQSR